MFLLIMRIALTHIEDYTGAVPVDVKRKNQQWGFSRTHEYDYDRGHHKYGAYIFDLC
jgi:hypothetical protein